jgi:hypothetical protein
VQFTARKLHCLKTDAILLKLDITKAFDTVDWAFLLDVMAKLGFGRRWISMICGLSCWEQLLLEWWLMVLPETLSLTGVD